MKNDAQGLRRRELFHVTAATGAATVLEANPATQAVEFDSSPKIVDTNVNLFHWPFRRLPLDETDTLVRKLASLGISEAWAGSFEGLWHHDLAGVNARLADVCRQHEALVAIGSIHLGLPDWQDDWLRCIEKHDMPGVRLHPNYHGYRLDDPRFTQLLRRARDANRFVQIAVAMEDARTQHPLARVEDVDLVPLPQQMADAEGVRVQLLNYSAKGGLTQALAKCPGLFMDMARVDGTDAIAKLVRVMPAGRVMLGTHAPFLIPDAALIRVVESRLSEDECRLVLSGGIKS